MTLPAWDDLSAFTDTDDFGVKALILFSDGSTREVIGIFDAPYQLEEAGDYSQDDITPMFTAPASALAGVRKKDSVEINGRIYGVLTYPQPDGTGMAALKLVLE